MLDYVTWNVSRLPRWASVSLVGSPKAKPNDTDDPAYTTVCCHDYQTGGATPSHQYVSRVQPSSVKWQMALKVSAHIFAFIENTDDWTLTTHRAPRKSVWVFSCGLFFFLLVCFLPLKKRGAGNQINLLSGFILFLKLILCRRVIRGTSWWRKNLGRPCRPTLTFQIHRPSVTASLLAHASDCTV